MYIIASVFFFSLCLCIKSNLFAPGIYSDFFYSKNECDEKGDENGNLSCTHPDLDNRVIKQISGGHDTCFLVDLFIQNNTFRVQIDTGSSDTALPHSSLNNYEGPTLAFSIPEGQESSQYNRYGDGSWWKGYMTRMDVGAVNSTDTYCPVALMTSQSKKPVFASGISYNGLLGLAFPSLAATKSDPRTVVDALYDSGAIKRNEIAFHGCPFSDINDSYIDIGNDTPYSACGGLKVSVQIANPEFYSLDILEIGFDRVAQPLPSAFQTRHLSILDSCTSNILLPHSTLLAFVEQIYSSKAFSSQLVDSGYLLGWLYGNYRLNFVESDIDWEILPTLSFTFSSHMTIYENVTLEIGPRQYIQKVTNDNFWAFMVDSFGSNELSVLGYPFFTAFHIVLDRSNAAMTFSPGCGCEDRKDKFPLIYTNEYANNCTKTSSEVNSTQTSWTCSTLANLHLAVATRFDTTSAAVINTFSSQTWVRWVMLLNLVFA